jgi:hypothetical protein
MLSNENKFSPEGNELIYVLYSVEYFENGKQKRKSFADKQKAENYLRLLKVKLIEEKNE